MIYLHAVCETADTIYAPKSVTELKVNLFRIFKVFIWISFVYSISNF